MTRLQVLLAVLVGLIGYVWLTDKLNPAHPHGQLGGVLIFAALFVILVGGPLALIVVLIRQLTGRWKGTIVDATGSAGGVESDANRPASF